MKDPLLIKKCLTCGKELEIRLKRDIERKKYCSKSCAYKDYHKRNPGLLKNLDKGRNTYSRKKAGKTLSKKVKAGEIIFKGKIHIKPLIVPNLIYSIENDGKKIYDIIFLPRIKRCTVCFIPISTESTNNLCRRHFNETKKNKVEITCLNCDKVVEKIPSHLNDTNNNFCTASCCYAYKRKQPKKQIKIICKNCGKIVYRYPSLLYGKNAFCCAVCSAKYYGKLYRKTCHFYIDGRTPLVRLLRNNGNYANWRLSVLERNSARCELCGEKHQLHVHHKKHFSVIFNEFLNTYETFSPDTDIDTLLNLSENYTDFWDVDNGQVLCKECHYKKHPDVYF